MIDISDIMSDNHILGVASIKINPQTRGICRKS
jgi:hypothetical protein